MNSDEQFLPNYSANIVRIVAAWTKSNNKKSNKTFNFFFASKRSAIFSSQSSWFFFVYNMTNIIDWIKKNYDETNWNEQFGWLDFLV